LTSCRWGNQLPVQWRSAARTRATAALERVAHQYGVSADLEAVRHAERDWEPLAIAMLAEAVAGLLLDVRPRPGSVERKRHRLDNDG